MSFWNKAALGRRTAKIARPLPEDRFPAESFEALEPRTLLYTTPFLAGLPALSLLENPNDTVVRIHTSMGNIDIELYDAAAGTGSTTEPAPLTVANFLRYLNMGRLDETFIHRSADTGTDTDFVVQGGGFYFDDITGLDTVNLGISGTDISVDASDSSFTSATRGAFSRIRVGDRLTTTGFGSAANNGTFTVTRVISNEKFTVAPIVPLVTEAAGATVTVDFATVADEPGADADADGKADTRSNLERTIAMARRGNNPFTPEDESKDSATSQFFFNMQDNSFLDADGFSVFGKVIQGWDIVQAIAGLPVHDYADIDRKTQTPLPGANEDSFALREVPVQGTVTEGGGLPSQDLREFNLVFITDGEVIKAQNSDRFYGEVLYYPEGWRGNTVRETVHLMNTDLNTTVFYQIIAHFETAGRDQVLASGRLVPGAREAVRISDFADSTFISNVPENRGFAYEIRVTPRPPNSPGGSFSSLAASLEHFDFGVLTEESFISVGQLTVPTLLQWGFGHANTGVGHSPFVTFQNISNQTTTVRVIFYTNAGSFSSSKTIEAQRRGGLNINQISPPSDAPQLVKDAWAAGLPFSMLVTSDQPIIAASSQYFSQTASPAQKLGSSAAGTVGGALSAGFLAAARIPTGGQSVVSLMYSSTVPPAIIVNFEFFLTDGTRLNGQPLVLASGRHADYNLATANPSLPLDQFFSIRYSVQLGSGALTAHYFAVDGGDAVSTPFSVVSTNTLYFSDLFLDPTSSPSSYNEYLSIFNPYSDPTVTVTYRVRFHFADSAGVEVMFPPDAQGTLGAYERVDLNLRALLVQLVPRIQSDPLFHNFSATVFADVRRGTSSIAPSAVVAQVTRVDSATGVSYTSLGMVDSGRPLLFMNDGSLSGAVGG